MVLRCNTLGREMRNLSWLLVNNIADLCTIGRDVIATHDGNHIVFYNIVSGSETIYSADHGVERFIGHRTSNIFAFSERTHNPRIFIVTYPEFKQIAVLKDAVDQIIGLEFVEAEYLIVLIGTPICKLVVWCWRSERRMASHNIDKHPFHHKLRGSDFQNTFCHIYNGKLTVWEIIPTYKSCLIYPRYVNGDDVKFTDVAWTSDNLYGADDAGNIHSLTIDGLHMMLNREFIVDDGIKQILHYKSGLIIFGRNLQYWKKYKTGWKCSWTYNPTYSLIWTASPFNELLLSMNSIGDLSQLTYENDSINAVGITRWERQIVMFDIVRPSGDLVTLTSNNVISVRCLKTGILKSRALIKDGIYKLRSSPTQPIVALIGGTDKYGVILLGMHDMKIIRTKCLTHHSLKDLIWIRDKIVLSSYGVVFVMNEEFTELSHIDTESNVELINLINDRWILFTVQDELKCYNVDRGVESVIRRNGGFIALDDMTVLSYAGSTIDVNTIEIDGDSFKMNTIKTVEVDIELRGLYGNGSEIIGWNGSTVCVFSVFPTYSCEFTYRQCSGIKQAIVLNGDVVALNNAGDLITLTDATSVEVRKLKDIGVVQYGRLFDDSTDWLGAIQDAERSAEFDKWRDKRRLVADMNTSLGGKLDDLIRINSELPELYRLSLTSFIMNTDKYSEIQRRGLEQCDVERRKIVAEITARENVADWIQRKCWDCVSVVGTELRSIFTDKLIENYSVTDDCESESDLLQSMEACNADLMQTWSDIFGDDAVSSGKLSESTAGYFVAKPTFTSVQILLHSFLQMNWYTSKTKQTTRSLQMYFNTKFDEVMELKRSEMRTAAERSDRLQFIISELTSLRKLNGNHDEIQYRLDIPEWTNGEIPSNLIKVDPSEVGVSPYVSGEIQSSSSETVIKDPFYKQALIEMMDGTLYKLWHEEIKRDIPKPVCMTEKNPDDFDEADTAEISEWENNVRQQRQDRKRYGIMLKQEFEQLSTAFNDNIIEFNQRFSELYSLKLKIESAIAQEELKLMLIRTDKLNRIDAFDRQKEIESEIFTVESEQERIYVELNEVQNQLAECHAARDTIVTKNRMMDKNFRSNFQDVSDIVIDLCYKLFAKRPKWNPKQPISAALLAEMAQACLTREIQPLLHPDCVKYLKSVDQMDLLSNMPPVMDEIIWVNMCKLRRAKIDNEIKERVIRAEIADVEAAYATWQKRLSLLRTVHQKLKTDLANHHTFMENQIKNVRLQLIIRRGLVEVKMTGHLEDFDGAILIKREEIDAVYQQIKDAEDIKMRAERETNGFKKHIVTKEWEHASLKMKMKQLEKDLYYFQRIRITKEIQQYIQDRSVQKYNRQEIESKIQITKSHFHKQLYQRIQYTEELEMKIGTVRTNIQLLDGRIEQLKDEIRKKRDIIDSPRNEEYRRQVVKRMKAMVWRNRLVSEVQSQNTTIILLQTELELQRLRTYPTLTYQTH